MIFLSCFCDIISTLLHTFSTFTGSLKFSKPSQIQTCQAFSRNCQRLNRAILYRCHDTYFVLVMIQGNCLEGNKNCLEGNKNCYVTWVIGRITAVRLDRSLNTLAILKQCLLILLGINVTIIISSLVGKKFALRCYLAIHLTLLFSWNFVKSFKQTNSLLVTTIVKSEIFTLCWNILKYIIWGYICWGCNLCSR